MSLNIAHAAYRTTMLAHVASSGDASHGLSRSRERAAAALGDHFAAGRLDTDEFDERVRQVYLAKTAADLVPLFADLPDARRAIAEPQRVRRHPRREAAALRTLLLMVLVLGAVLSLAVIQIPLIFLLPVLWIAFARHHFARHHFARRSCRAW